MGYIRSAKVHVTFNLDLTLPLKVKGEVTDISVAGSLYFISSLDVLNFLNSKSFSQSSLLSSSSSSTSRSQQILQEKLLTVAFVRFDLPAIEQGKRNF